MIQGTVVPASEHVIYIIQSIMLQQQVRLFIEIGKLSNLSMEVRFDEWNYHEIIKTTRFTSMLLLGKVGFVPHSQLRKIGSP